MAKYIKQEVPDFQKTGKQEVFHPIHRHIGEQD